MARVILASILLLCFLAATAYVWIANEVRTRSLSPLSEWLDPSYRVAVAAFLSLWAGIIWRKRWLSVGGAAVGAAMFGIWIADNVLHKEGLAAGRDEYARTLVAQALDRVEESHPCRDGWQLALVRYPPNGRDHDDLRWQLLPPDDTTHGPVDVMVRDYRGEMIPTTVSRRFGNVRIDVEATLETCTAQPEVRD